MTKKMILYIIQKKCWTRADLATHKAEILKKKIIKNNLVKNR